MSNGLMVEGRLYALIGNSQVHKMVLVPSSLWLFYKPFFDNVPRDFEDLGYYVNQVGLAVRKPRR
jgi:hypothetical protein